MAPTVTAALAALKKAGSKKVRDGYARYGIPATKAFGIPMAEIQRLAKGLGRSHELAQELWASGWYEARMLAAYVDEPARVTPAQMDAWCADFDSWAVCDTVCFALFDRTPHTWTKIEAWATREPEFEKRAAFALLAGVALHDKSAIEDKLARSLAWCEAAADDRRNFVWKGVSWALRTIGVRDAALHAKVIAVAERLAARAESARLGKDVLRDLRRPLVTAKLANKAKKAKVTSSPRSRATARRAR